MMEESQDSECPKKYTRNKLICQYCDKRFAKKQKLEVHIRVHTNERPFGCMKCDTYNKFGGIFLYGNNLTKNIFHKVPFFSVVSSVELP